MIRFINRRTELDFLERKTDASGSQFVVIYGRRRVGKTELIKQFCSGKNALYFLADKRGTLLNLERFAEKAADHFNDIPPRVENFYDLFRYLVLHTGSRRYIIAIDEFSYLIERDETIPSVFQVIWDEYLKEENVMLILCGSSVSMMLEGVLSEKSPLYGRRTGQWKLESLKAYHIPEFYQGIDAERAIEFYSVLGGIPLYLLEFDPEKNVFENIREHILTKGEILYEEAETLLKEELREYYLYISIFEAIAKGKTRLVEISDYSKVPQKDLPKYVGTLMRLELVGKEHPVTEAERSKKTRYFIKDNFFRFYFRYVHPNKAEIEYGYSEKVVQVVKKDFDSFVGILFENIARDFMMKPETMEKLPFSFSRVGRQWGKIKGAPRGKNVYEIDIVGLNDKSKEIMFIECKWKELSERDAMNVLNEVKEKSRFVQWNKGARKEYFGLVAKNIGGKDKLRTEGSFVFDLDDF
ncbi:MAG: ATP-binding protein [Euryarchaeota archaeon]|nr:ATP-binding protein [Euryarchaeota archaeon]